MRVTSFIQGEHVFMNIPSDLIKDTSYDTKLLMSLQKKLFLAIGIILLDLVVFFLPLTSFFLAYVIIYNPSWVKDFLERLG